VTMNSDRYLQKATARGDRRRSSKTIQAHNQLVEALSTRLGGLTRADQLFESDQAAAAELLQASIDSWSGITRETATTPAAATQRGGGIQIGGCNMKIGRAQSVARTNEPIRRTDPGRHDSCGHAEASVN